MAIPDLCLNDDSFGPVVRGCRGHFDFTVAFENIVFVILPALLFLCIGVCRAWILARRRRPVVAGSGFRTVKLGFTACMAALHLTLLILNRESLGLSPATSWVAPVLSFGAAILLIALSWLEHCRSPRPSTIIATYLFVTMLFDLARTRTAWLRIPSGLDRTYAVILTTTTIVKAVIICLESRQKISWLNWDLGEHSPEETSGIYDLGVFFWLNKLFMQGYRTILTLENLYPLDKALATESTHDDLPKGLRTHGYEGKKYGLARLLLQLLATHLLPPVLPRIALLAASMCQPLLLHALLHYLQTPEETQNHGYGLIGATALTYGAIAISTALYWYFQERFAIRVRGTLIRAVYKKTTELRTLKDGDSGALTLMSTDVERIARGVLDLHEYWANVIQIALSCWLLQRELGPAFAASLVVVTLSTIAAFGIGKLLGPRQRAWMEAIETRVGTTATAIADMKLIKMSGMTKAVHDHIQALRLKEIGIGGRWRMLLAAAATVSQIPMIMSPVFTFATASKTLDTTSIFVSISYLTLLASPLMTLFQKIPQFLGALTCMQRVQVFLERDPRSEYRHLDLGTSTHISKETDSVSKNAPEASSMPKENDTRSSTPYVVIENGNFGWYKDDPVLQRVNVNIAASRLTAVVGPVASGKSTLCKAILGEVPFSDGSIAVLRSRHVGYCDQQPFLTNTSVRDNIIVHGAFDEKQYNAILIATMLDHDLATFPQGDMTLIGSGGIALSGGQRQRVAIARALYAAGADLLIFDDVLSGLDAKTTEHVFRHVFGRDGMLRRRGATVLMCTHNTQHIQAADYAIRIDGHGEVREEQPEVLQEIVPDAQGDLIPISEESKSIGDPRTEANGVPIVPAAMADKAEGRKLGDKGVFRYYARTIGAFPVVVLIVASAGYGFLTNFPRVWLTFWADDAARPSRDLVQLHSQSYYIGIYGLLQALALLTFMSAALVVLGPFIRLSGSVLHQRALNTVIHAPLRLFATSDTGTITNHFSQDITLIDNELPLTVVNVLLGLFGAIGMSALIAASSPWLALTYPAMVLVLWLIQRFYLRTSRQLRLLDLEAKSPLYTHFLDTSKGIATLRAFGWMKESIDRNHVLLNQSQRPMYLLAMVQRWLTLTLDMVIAITATTLVGLLTQLRSSSSLSGASLVTLMTLSQSLSDIVRAYASLETSIGAVGRLRRFITQTGTECDAQDDGHLDPKWPSKGAIQAQGVWARYGESGEDYALRGVDVSIRPGERIGVCGRTGSGKSSLVLLLLALLDPVSKEDAGYVLSVDGISLSFMDRKTLRERFITVPQEPVFLPAGSTVRENLDPLSLATTEQCRDVLQAIGLSEMVEGAGGLDGVLYESALSQGQRQIFNLARAVLKRKTAGGAVLLLDEFTSSVDLETEKNMLSIMDRAFAGCTIIMVAHRLHMVSEFCDRVLVMDRGTVVEDGNPRTLSKMDGTWYASLLAAMH